MNKLWLFIIMGLLWWCLPTSESEASTCLTRTALVAMPNGSLAPTLCNQYGQLYAVSVNSDGTQLASAAPSSLLVNVRYEVPYYDMPALRQESPYLHRVASDSLTCTTTSTPQTFQIGQPVPVQCNQYGQLLVELSGVGASAIIESTVAELPGSPPSGTIRIVTDGDSQSDCTVGAGSTRVLCNFDGSNWVGLSGVAEADTLDTVFDRGKTIDGANSLANAVRIGDGTTPICLYTDATLGPQVRPCTDANVLTVIPTDFTWSLFDVEGALAIETVDPDAASTLLMWSYPNAAYRPKQSHWFDAREVTTDGAQCAAAAQATINSGPLIWSIICADNAGSSIYGKMKMPDNWDAGTVTFEHVYIQTAADTGVLNGDIAAQCYGNGEVVGSTWNEVAIDDAAVTGSSKNDFTVSAAVTPAGTCAAGDMLYWRYQLDTATTTAVATLHHLGFKMEYGIVSRSE